MSTIAESAPNRPAQNKVNGLVTPPASELDAAPTEAQAKWQEALSDWVKAGATPELRLHCDPLDAPLEALTKLLEDLDICVKYDWYSITGTVVVTVIRQPHELPYAWLNRMQPQIQEQISRVALCGVPVVEVEAGTTIKFEHWAPTTDGAVLLKYKDGSGWAVPAVGTIPRIVLETADTQTPACALTKATRLLHESNNDIQAVIVCIIRDSMGQEMQAEIDVWVREPSEKDFELDSCQHEDGDGIHKVALDEAVSVSGSDVQSSEQSEGPTPPTPALGSSDNHDFEAGEWTSWEHDQFSFQEAANTAPLRIRRRKKYATVVYDQRHPEISDQGCNQYLVLDVYDILRPCSAYPFSVIDDKDRAIRLPLASLQKDFRSKVAANQYLANRAKAPAPSKMAVFAAHAEKRPRRTPSRYPQDLDPEGTRKRQQTSQVAATADP
ncbi:hypothetical protein FRC07_001353 [Ceratobasidium sp. 392]|nr:hypothetical protein FRC07_001353 [Ceratobasidium sp. 392]